MRGSVCDSEENICILSKTVKRWKELLDEDRMLYLYAMTNIYSLGCNMKPEASVVAYMGMQE